MYANAVNAVTYEGDNFVIGRSVPRAILKHYRNETEASLPTLSYLAKVRRNDEVQPPVSLDSDRAWLRQDVQRWALETRLSNLVQAHKQDSEEGRDTSYSSHALTMAHSDFVYWRGFCALLTDLDEREPSFLAQVHLLHDVFALSILQHPHHPTLAHALPLSTIQQRALRAAFESAVDQLATNHLSMIIDAYGFTEYEMDSALARTDKSPYEALFEEGAKRSEMSGNGMRHLWPMMVDTRQIWRRVEGEQKRMREVSAKL
jgi:acyl-CoA oxidase